MWRISFGIHTRTQPHPPQNYALHDACMHACMQCRCRSTETLSSTSFIQHTPCNCCSMFVEYNVLTIVSILEFFFYFWVWAEGLRTCGGGSAGSALRPPHLFSLAGKRQVGSLKNRHGFALRPSHLNGGGGSSVPSGMDE